MNLIEKIKKWLNIEKSENNSIEQERTTNLSIIDISNLEIDRNLTKEENESRKKRYLQETFLLLLIMAMILLNKLIIIWIL